MTAEGRVVCKHARKAIMARPWANPTLNCGQVVAPKIYFNIVSFIFEKKNQRGHVKSLICEYKNCDNEK